MTNVTRINNAAFERLATFLEQHPKKHFQGSWFENDECGSTGCVAGWVCIHETDDFEVINGQYYPTLDAYWNWFGEGLDHDNPENRMDRFVNGYDEWTGAYFFVTARRILGLTSVQAFDLFNMGHGPLNGLTVAEALHKIATGAEITEVWGEADE